MKISVILAAIIVAIIGSGCTSKYTLMETKKEVRAKPVRHVKFEYRIQPHDRLSVVAYKYPELMPTSMNENGILVDSNGYISLPLIHRVKVAGLTQGQAAKLLERRYRTYLKDPSFNVEVLNKRIYVLGEVKKPGVVKLDREKLTVLEALAFAGDLTDNAVRDNIIILSKSPSGNLSMRKVDLTNFETMKMTDMVVHPDDIIYVQPNTWKKFKVSSENISSVLGIVSNLVSPYLLIRSATR